MIDFWTTNDTWIVIVAALAAIACGIPGCFLLLRRMSMMGDAISHAVLPGIAVAFLLTGSRDATTMFLGATAAGVATALLTQLVHRFGRVDEHASMGVVFTTLFAIGLLLIVRGAEKVDLDAGCVLYGSIEFIPLDVMSIAGFTMPRAAFQLLIFLLLNLAFITIFFKELKLTTFDPEAASALGFRPQVLQLILLALIAATTVAAFEAVGSILVVSLIIAPAATAALLTNRLWSMLVVAGVAGIAASILGRILAITGPSIVGFPDLDMNTAGAIAIAAGLVFTVAAFVAPERGVIRRTIDRAALRGRILREDALGLLYRFEERRVQTDRDAFRRELSDALDIAPWKITTALRRLQRRGFLRMERSTLQLTDNGRDAASTLVRSHRLWEAYLARHIAVPSDHLHDTAMALEHITGDEMQADLARATGDPALDPHGTSIPAARDQPRDAESRH